MKSTTLKSIALALSLALVLGLFTACCGNGTPGGNPAFFSVGQIQICGAE